MTAPTSPPARTAASRTRARNGDGASAPSLGGFAEALNYTSVNEDWRAEQLALQIDSDDRVLCLTGSGERSLVLLEHDPALVVSVDLNPCQTRLLELKQAAMRAMDHAEFAAFLGLVPGVNRLEQLQRLEPSLSTSARAYWHDHAAVVERGLLYQGRWERHHLMLARIARVLRGRSVRRLFACEDLEEQRAFVRRTWDRRWWRLVLRVLCSPLLARITFGDPAFYAHVDPEMTVGDYIYDRMHDSLTHHLARDNFMMSFVLQGHMPETDLPPYLAASSYESIRSRLDRLESRTAEVTEVMETASAGSFTRFSLSDAPSYVDDSGFARLLRSMVHAATPGARFCIRQFLSGYRVPHSIGKWLRREPGLEKRLETEDRAFAYRFIVGTVRK